jgi:hypothetical protein
MSGDNFVSGGTFPLGDTKLACNASDEVDNNGANAQTSYFHVIVTDQPATLTVPPIQLAQATSSSGATVYYAPGPVTATEIGATATEADTPLCSTDKVAVPLTLPDGSSDGFVSGGTFPVGVTTVTCGAPVNDDPTNPGQQQSFTVIVTASPPTSKVNVRFHYSADGSAGGWSGTKTLSPSGGLTIGPQAMEGNLIVNPGDVLNVGYDFTMPGSHPATTLGFFNTTVTFQAVCASGSGGGTFAVSVPALQYTDPLDSSAWYPSGNQPDPSVYQGSITVPDLCAGRSISLQHGGTFTTTVGAL